MCFGMMKHFGNVETIVMFILCLNLVHKNNGIPKEAFMSDKFIVGRIAELEDFPFMASLRIKSVHYCASTIIHPKWAITAAQCYQIVPFSDYTIVSSTQQLNYNSGLEHKVINITLSPDGDLALLEIADTFKETPAILTKNMLGNFELGIIVGWGFTATPGTTPKDLRMVYLRIMQDSECNVRYNDYKPKAGLICMMPKSKHLGICTGDVGAPLVANGKVYAVAAWRKNCLDNGPEVFYSLPYRYQWITSVIM